MVDKQEISDEQFGLIYDAWQCMGSITLNKLPQEQQESIIESWRKLQLVLCNGHACVADAEVARGI